MINLEKNISAEDRRSGQDRRNWECQHEFPYIDSHGVLVIEDRRVSNDRRKDLPTSPA